MKLLIKLFGKNAFIQGTSYEKKIDYINYYLIQVLCANCKNIMNIYIKKGVHINDIVTGIKCNYCNCRLEKQEK
jgi:hypothetical protein